MMENNPLRPQFGGNSSPPKSFSNSSPTEFLKWLESKHQQELEKLHSVIFPPQPKSIPYPNCLPQFNRHRWTAFGVNLPQGKIYQCQFCFNEKLVPHSPQFSKTTDRIFGFYYPPQTYYIR